MTCRCLLARAGRIIPLVALLGAWSAPLTAGSTVRSVPAVARSTVGESDLLALDTDAERYTHLPNGLTRLRVYISPVGAPDGSGWHLRLPGQQAIGVGPATADTRQPSSGALAARAGVTPEATVTNEDGVRLGVDLTPLTATASSTTSIPTLSVTPSATPGGTARRLARPSGTATRTPTATPPPASLSVRPSLAGLDIRVAVPAPRDAGPFVVTLAPDPRAAVVQDTDAVLVRRALVGVGDDGTTPSVTDQTEYVVGPPVARDGRTDAVVPQVTSAVSMTLLHPGTSAPQLALHLDPAWLRDPRRAFPVRLDVPVVTAYAAAHSGVFGAVTPCAPDAPAPTTDVLVGLVGRCAQRGEIRFDVASLLPDTPVVSATLHLFTPRLSGPAAVTVYPNAPATAPADNGQLTWRAAPPVLTGTVGAAPAEAAAGWQTWDVTGAARRWVADPASNAGLTLVRQGAPVLFASTLGAARDAAQAPYLDITYASRSAVTPSFDDGAASIYGVAGAFVPDGYRGTRLFPCPLSLPACAPAGAIRIGAVAAPQPRGVGGSYIRVSVALSCRSARPGYAWWNQDNRPNNVRIYDLLKSVYAARPRLIPIVNLLADDACLHGGVLSRPAWWTSEAEDFIAHLSDTRVKLPAPLPGMIYFEIGNEVNIHPDYALYPRFFAAAAGGLNRALAARDAHARTKTPYRILTAGMLYPSTAARILCSPRDDPNHDNIAIARQAIALARSQARVADAHLGIGVHPYTYNTPDHHGYWRNYYGLYHNDYAGVCRDLRDMIVRWTGAFPGLPVVFTEDNWGSTLSPRCRNPAGIKTDRLANCTGAYLVDLFTWLHRHGYDDPRNSPIRVAWFRGADSGDALLGLYGPRGEEKPVTITACPSREAGVHIAGSHPISSAYFWLRRAGCYEPGGP